MKQQIPREEYLKNLPTKRTGVAVIFFNEEGEVLILKPNYRDKWQVPGGTVDENESPKQAAIRETKEEIGITVDDLTFLCVEYKSIEAGDLDFLEFIFLGETLTKKDIDSIVLDENEIDEYKFVTTEEALLLFRTSLKRRFPIGLEAIKTGKPTYSEF